MEDDSKMNDEGFNAPTPDQGRGDVPQAPMPDPMSGGASWKKTLIIAAVVIVVGGAVGAYFFGSSNTEFYYSYDSNYQGDTYEQPSYDYDYNYDEDFDVRYWVEESSEPGYMTFTNSTYGYMIDYPANWDYDADNFASFFMSQYEDADDLILENASLATEDVSYFPAITVEEYGDLSLEGLATDPAYVLEDRGYQELGPYEGEYLLGSYVVEDITLEVISLYTIVEDTVYLFTYTYEPVKSYLYEDIVEYMIESFDVVGEVDAASGMPSFEGEEELASHAGKVSLIHSFGGN